MRYLLILIFIIFALSFSKDEIVKPDVTLVELGSLSCTPCKKMKDVLSNLETKYGKQLEIIFHDVKSSKGKTESRKYNIRMIPTQVFLDKEGKEFYRHEGYFPEDKIDTLLVNKGLISLEKKND
ncbi:MAG: thioredoxin family protein [Candidatus Delongbacteria bacterium]|nr:thioredoxin family protein [Candidatus Delongbacteria bacterium]MBN2836906.1 thioredoxin family protein [Candidatus Delongbacteria bacterium]